MANQLEAVPNPKFRTAPLTTIAGDIVSRRELKVPVDISGTYGHQNNSQGLQSTAIFTIAANEEFVNLERMTIVADMTPSFFSYATGYLGPKCTTVPLLDGSLQSLIAKFRIGNSQGLCIEEVLNYPTFAAAISKFVDSPIKRQQDLLNFSTQGTTCGAGDKWNLLFDSPFYLQANNVMKNGETIRVHFRLMHSSFKNRVPMIPLFLFKNGLQFSLTFESPYRSFCYQLTQPQSNEQRIPARYDVHAAATNNYHRHNWIIAPGIYDSRNTNNAPVARTEITLAAALNEDRTFLETGVLSTAWKYLSLDKVFPATTYGNYVPLARNSLLLNYDSLQALKKNMPRITSPNTSLQNNDMSVELTVADQYGFVVIPVRFEKDKQCVWSGFAIYNNLHDYESTEPTDARIHYWAINGAPTQSYARVSAWVNVKSTGYQYGTNAGIVGLSISEPTQKPFFVMQLYGMTVASLPFKHDAGTFDEFNLQMIRNDYDLILLPDQAFVIPYTIPAAWDELSLTPAQAFTVSSTINHSIASPIVVDWIHRALNSGRTSLVWDYTLKNLEMKIDLVKPNANVFQNWVTRYQDVSGIPYAFKRTHYNVSTMYGNQRDTVANIQLKLSLRSLCGLVVVLQDTWSTVINNGTDPGYTTLNYNSITAFMRRGVTRAEVIIGGQSYPIYPLKFLPDGTSAIQWGMDHIVSAENFFDTTQSSFQGTLDRRDLVPSRNYLGCGDWGLTFEQHISKADNKTGIGYYYLDTTGFVIAFSFMKDDTNGMFTGIDTTQSAVVQLNLYFDRPDTLITCDIDRSFYVHSWAVCDAVFTLQSDASLLRQ